MRHKLIYLAILASVLFIPSKGFAFGDDDIVFFPDSNLKIAIITIGTDNSQLGFPDVDINRDGEIQYSEAKRTTGKLVVPMINSYNMLAINDMTGIKAFTAIDKLELYNDGGKATLLDVSGMSNLEEIIMAGNGFVEINITGCTSLERLYCSDNNLTNIIFSKTTIDLPLTSFVASTNKLIDLDFSQFQELRYIKIRENNLTKLNIANGNNKSNSYFNILNNPDLKCVTVDDPVWSEEIWKNIDEWTKFSKDCSSSIKDKNENLFFFYPNPTSNSITINRNIEKQVDLRILDINGKICLSHTILFGQKRIKLNLSHLAKGSYILEIDNRTKLLIIE